MYRSIIPIFVFFSLLSFPGSLEGRKKYLIGRGYFYSSREDSLKFINEQLLYNAFRNIISKELRRKGFKQALFWKIFDEKFEKSFMSIEEMMKANPSTTKATLRLRRFVEKTRFGKISRMIRSYKIKKIPKFKVENRSYEVVIQARVDRELLNNFYYKYNRTRERSPYDSLYISTQFFLKYVQANDLEAFLEETFPSLLEKSWKEWFEKNLKNHASKIILTRGNDRDHLKKINIDGRSLHLKIDLHISQVFEDPIFKQKTLLFAGEFILSEINSDHIVAYGDMKKVQRKLSFFDKDTFKKEVNEILYNMPISLFKRIPEQLEKNLESRRKKIFIVDGTSSLKDLISFKGKIVSLGVFLGISVEIQSLKEERGELIVSFSGEDHAFDKFLKVLQGDNNSHPWILIKQEKSVVTFFYKKGLL